MTPNLHEKVPFYVQWHITNYCNLRCRHCYQDDFSKDKDLNWAGLEKISDTILATMESWEQRACIHVTGGEPLSKPEVFQLLEYLGQSRWVDELGLITNGLCFNPTILKKLSVIPKLSKMKISLDGAEAEINDSVRQRGVFEKVMQALSRLREEGRFEIILMFTVMKRNFKNLSSFVHLCQDLEIDGLILERFIPWGRGREIISEVLNRTQWNEVIETLASSLSIEGEDHRLFPYQAFQLRFKNGETELLGAPCIVGTDGLCVMPEGTIFPCRRFPVSLGNLLEQPLDQIWRKSEVLEQVRKKENLKGKCRTCEVEDCRGCRSLAFALTGDYLEEDPHCCHFPS
jgi:radical SAM protein with 4Fe4S-binding SPASM domain